MAVKRDGNRRWVEVEAEVPGTPEEVWEAIATAHGVSSWFVPTEVKQGADGEPDQVVSHFGPGMDSVATPTVWEPPRRFGAETADFGADAPSVATEWIVEAKAGGTCIVRVVHSMVTESDEWDEALEQFESGWPTFFRNLRVYLTHFRGQYGATVQVMGSTPQPTAQAWQAFTAPLGLAGLGNGERWRLDGDGPPVSGHIEYAGDAEPDLQRLIRLETPTPGMAHLFALAMMGQVFLVLRLYLYGDEASSVAARDEPLWQAWMQARFPMGGG